jgi:benzoate/toluate 1,2-dioxygenase alpha subunit
MTQSLDRVGPSIEKVLSDAVVDDREAGVIKANRRIFTDEEIFELEMKHIFEGNWIYLAHESQIPTRTTTSQLIWAASRSLSRATAMAN